MVVQGDGERVISPLSGALDQLVRVVRNQILGVVTGMRVKLYLQRHASANSS